MLRVLRWAWTLPNQVAGAIGAVGGRVARREVDTGAVLVVGSWLGKFMSKKGLSSATTLGDFILIGRPESVAHEALIAHERIHIRQSNALGWLYLPATGIGYLISGFRSGFKDWHDASPLEIDADLRSGIASNVEGNRFASARLRRSLRDS